MPLRPIPRHVYPGYPARRTWGGKARIFGAAVAALALLSSPLHAGAEGHPTPPESATRGGAPDSSEEPDWMLWLDEVGFCPMMDCEPETAAALRVEQGRMAGATMSPSPNVTRRYVRRQRNQLRGCYARALIGAPQTAGGEMA